MMLGPDEGAWVPVRRRGEPETSAGTEVALAAGIAVEAAPGLWPTGAKDGMIFVCNLDDMEKPLETGDVVAEVCTAAVQTRVCGQCGDLDTDAWIQDDSTPVCEGCETPRPGGATGCSRLSRGLFQSRPPARGQLANLSSMKETT